MSTQQPPVTSEQRALLLRLAKEARAFTKGSLDPLCDWIADAEARACGQRTYIEDEPTESLIKGLENAIAARQR